MTDEPQSALPSPRRPTSTARSRDYRRRKREGLLRAVIELRRYEVANSVKVACYCRVKKASPLHSVTRSASSSTRSCRKVTPLEV